MSEEYKPLSVEFLVEAERCCRSGCDNCPYTPRHRGGTTIDRVWAEFSKANPKSTYDEFLEFLRELKGSV